MVGHGVFSNQTGRPGLAPFKVNTSGDGYYLVKLVERATGQDAFLLFLHGGRSAEIDVPLGTYEMRYASGDTWYGMTDLFGEDTVYSKSDSVLSFANDGYQYTGHEVTLYTVRHGNMRTRRIGKSDF